jgi:hypothetical protein
MRLVCSRRSSVRTRRPLPFAFPIVRIARVGLRLFREGLFRPVDSPSGLLKVPLVLLNSLAGLGDVASGGLEGPLRSLPGWRSGRLPLDNGKLFPHGILGLFDSLLVGLSSAVAGQRLAFEAIEGGGQTRQFRSIGRDAGRTQGLQTRPLAIQSRLSVEDCGGSPRFLKDRSGGGVELRLSRFESASRSCQAQAVSVVVLQPLAGFLQFRGGAALLLLGLIQGLLGVADSLRGGALPILSGMDLLAGFLDRGILALLVVLLGFRRCAKDRRSQ